MDTDNRPKVPDSVYETGHREHPHNFYNRDCCNAQPPVTDSFLKAVMDCKDISTFTGYTSAHYLVQEKGVSGFYFKDACMIDIHSSLPPEGLLGKLKGPFKHLPHIDLDSEIFLQHSVLHRYPQMRQVPYIVSFIQDKLFVHASEFWKIDKDYTLLLLTDKKESFAALTVINENFKDMANNYIRSQAGQLL